MFQSLSKSDFLGSSATELLVMWGTNSFLHGARSWAAFALLFKAYPQLRYHMDGRSATRALPDWLSPGTWIRNALINRGLDTLCAFVVSKLRPSTYANFPTWVHGMQFALNSFQSVWLRWVPSQGAMLMDSDYCLDALKQHDAYEQAWLDFPSAAKTRLATLVNRLAIHYRGENAQALAPMLLEWSVDSFNHVAAICLAGYTCRKLGFKWEHAYTCTTIPAWGVLAFCSNYFSGLLKAKLWPPPPGFTPHELVARKQLAVDELGKLLEGFEPMAVEEMKLYAADVCNSLMTRHSVRLEALKFLLKISQYQEGVNEGMMPRVDGGGGGLAAGPQMSQQFSFEPMSPTTAATVDTTHTQCMICLEDYAPGDKLAELECKHSFHVECIQDWLRTKKKCPACQKAYKPRRAQPEGEGAQGAPSGEMEGDAGGPIVNVMLRNLSQKWQDAPRLPKEIENANWGTVKMWCQTRGILDEQTLNHLPDDFHPRSADFTDAPLATFLWVCDLYPEGLE